MSKYFQVHNQKFQGLQKFRSSPGIQKFNPELSIVEESEHRESQNKDRVLESNKNIISGSPKA